MADLRVDIAAEFVGKKAFKEADMAAMRLDKTIKKLARTFGVTLGAGAICSSSATALTVSFRPSCKSSTSLSTLDPSLIRRSNLAFSSGPYILDI